MEETTSWAQGSAEPDSTMGSPLRTVTFTLCRDSRRQPPPPPARPPRPRGLQPRRSGPAAPARPPPAPLTSAGLPRMSAAAVHRVWASPLGSRSAGRLVSSSTKGMALLSRGPAPPVPAPPRPGPAPAPPPEPPRQRSPGGAGSARDRPHCAVPVLPCRCPLACADLGRGSQVTQLHPSWLPGLWDSPQALLGYASEAVRPKPAHLTDRWVI